MERIKCPLCGTSCITATDRSAWFELTDVPVILGHAPGPAASLNGWTVKHIGSFLCLASGCSVELAESIAADRRAGVHLLPHP